MVKVGQEMYNVRLFTEFNKASLKEGTYPHKVLEVDGDIIKIETDFPGDTYLKRDKRRDGINGNFYKFYNKLSTETFYKNDIFVDEYGLEYLREYMKNLGEIKNKINKLGLYSDIEILKAINNKIDEVIEP